jgi:hypothetical protein
MKILLLFFAIIVVLPACKKKSGCPVCTTTTDGMDIMAKIPFIRKLTPPFAMTL